MYPPADEKLANLSFGSNSPCRQLSTVPCTKKALGLSSPTLLRRVACITCMCANFIAQPQPWLRNSGCMVSARPPSAHCLTRCCGAPMPGVSQNPASTPSILFSAIISSLVVSYMPETWGAQLHQCAILRSIFSPSFQGGAPPDAPSAYFRFAKSGYPACVGDEEGIAIICSHLSSVKRVRAPGLPF